MTFTDFVFNRSSDETMHAESSEKSYNEAEHPRDPKGSPKAGKWREKPSTRPASEMDVADNAEGLIATVARLLNHPEQWHDKIPGKQSPRPQSMVSFIKAMKAKNMGAAAASYSVFPDRVKRILRAQFPKSSEALSNHSSDDES